VCLHVVTREFDQFAHGIHPSREATDFMVEPNAST
jgi:hypothetical protein